MRRIIIAGIHTEVGKTLVATAVARALGAHYWKPVQCGMPRDTDFASEHIGKERCYPERFCLKTPCSPHLAAEIEGVQIRASDLIVPDCSTDLVIEGTGGVLTPLNQEESWIDAAVGWDGDWILVYRPYLGSYNHCLLTVEALKSRNVRLLGIIFNGEVDAMLLARTGARLLGRLEWQQDLTACVKSLQLTTLG